MMKEIQHTDAAQQLWVVCRPALAHGDRTAKGCFLFRSTGILNTGRLLLSSTPHRDLDEVFPKIPNLLLPFTTLNTQQTHWLWNFPSIEIMILAIHRHCPAQDTTEHHPQNGHGSRHVAENPGDIPTKNSYDRNDDPHTIF